MSEPVAETADLPPCAGCEIPSSTLWCRRCSRLAGVALVEIDRFSVWLEQEADGFASRSPGTYMTTRSSAVESPSPAPVVDLIDKAYADLIAFEGAWRRHQGYPATRRTSLGRTTHDRALTLAFLGRHLESILREPKMVAEVRLVMRWRTVLRHYAHAEAERTERPGRCPRCHLVNVLRTEDAVAETIRCGNCSTVITEDQYRAEVVESPDDDVVPQSRRGVGG